MSSLSWRLGSAVVGQSGALSASGERRSPIGSLLREPLLHFLLIGSLLFAVHAVATPSVSKERLIEVTPEVRQSIVDLYKSKRNTEPGSEPPTGPSAEDLDRLIDVWVLNEVLYREAIAQGLDKGDEMIRERVIQKMRLLIFGNLAIKDPTDQELSQWFEAKRGQYDLPDVASFYEVPFTGPTSEADARAALAQIEAGSEPEEVRLKAHIFAERPRPSLESAFGKAFVDQITALPIAKWQVVQSDLGWHVVRMDSLARGRRTEMGDIATQLISDWKAERGRELGTTAIRDMAKSYVIRRVEP